LDYFTIFGLGDFDGESLFCSLGAGLLEHHGDMIASNGA
jgi:hypothetical protein